MWLPSGLGLSERPTEAADRRVPGCATFGWEAPSHRPSSATQIDAWESSQTFVFAVSTTGASRAPSEASASTGGDTSGPPPGTACSHQLMAVAAASLPRSHEVAVSLHRCQRKAASPQGRQWKT